MKDSELRRLNRSDLLEMLLELKKENDKLRRELDETQAKLNSRQIEISSAGSIAEASLKLSGVFEAAQSACQQYMDNIQNLSSRQEQICRQMEQETKAKCDRMVAEAKKQAQAYWDEYTARCEAYIKANPQLQYPVRK